jgi:hypothetical protein
VLTRIVDYQPPDLITPISTQQLGEEMPTLGVALPAILATLNRHGLIDRTSGRT